MSSTNRGGIREVSDYYKTPVSAIKDFLRACQEDISNNFGGQLIFDPCAGGRKGIEGMSYPDALAPLAVATMDIRQDSCADITADYLTMPNETAPDVIITNPPFALALPIIQKALTHVKIGGLVIMLLRLNFFGSQSRKAWLQANMPKYCYVHSKRMAFTAKGTDSIEYCHFVWVNGKHPKFTQLRVI